MQTILGGLEMRLNEAMQMMELLSTLKKYWPHLTNLSLRTVTSTVTST